MEKLIDIAKAHRTTGDRRPVSEFFRSAGYHRAVAYLDAQDVPPERQTERVLSYRANPSVAKVHPLIMMEYVRWVDYEKYCTVFMAHYANHQAAMAAVNEVVLRAHNPDGALNG